MRLSPFLRLLGVARARLGGSVAALDPVDVPAARDRSGRLQAGPLGRAVVGRRSRDVAAEDVRLTVPDRSPDAGPSATVPLPVRVYRPPVASADPPPVVVNFHGGGFVQGDLDQSDWFCGEVSRLAGAVVVSVDYRLAPEHPYPTPARDGYEVVATVAADPERFGVDADRLVVLGDSAGGNLSTVICLMARDRRRRGEPAPAIAAQCLVYPGVEMVDVLPSERTNPHAPILAAADIRGFHRLYLAGADGTEPYASPLRADLADLPPALVQVAEHDPLRDHGVRYAAALRAAGVPVRFTEYQGASHGYISLQALLPTTARQAAWEVAHTVRATGTPIT